MKRFSNSMVQQVQIAPSALNAPGASVVSAASNPLGLLHQLHPIAVLFSMGESILIVRVEWWTMFGKT